MAQVTIDVPDDWYQLMLILSEEENISVEELVTAIFMVGHQFGRFLADSITDVAVSRWLEEEHFTGYG